ncbi:hypothetical protein A2U01_0060889 [Trifolium medium]|uniref:Uncharacterized protein n=1 Tax=Trifolium medium TaxID=97028 RepID=A0A392RU39_9FABA|nr:hypothetical protein [Trifolium medium]
MTQEKLSNTLALLLVKSPKNLSTFSLWRLQNKAVRIYTARLRPAQGRLHPAQTAGTNLQNLPAIEPISGQAAPSSDSRNKTLFFLLLPIQRQIPTISTLPIN